MRYFGHRSSMMEYRPRCRTTHTLGPRSAGLLPGVSCGMLRQTAGDDAGVVAGAGAGAGVGVGVGVVVLVVVPTFPP